MALAGVPRLILPLAVNFEALSWRAVRFQFQFWLRCRFSALLEILS